MRVDERAISVALLGPPEVTVAGAPLEVDTRKAVALLAYLATERRWQARSTLAALLWPEAEEARARAVLRRTLSVLRRGLGGVGLEVERDRVRVDAGAVAVDLAVYDERLQTVAGHPHAAGDACPACLAPLVDATGLYRGEFLAGLAVRDAPDFELWQLAHAERLRSLQSSAMERLTAAYAATGDYADAIGTARRWLALDPWNEAGHRRLMVLCDWTGDRAAALRQYRACAELLERDLGVRPSEETERLHDDIAAGRLPPPPGGRARVVATGPVETAAPALPLVGRQAELAQLLAPLPAAATGHLWVVAGEAGIGKTRLVAEAATELRRLGYRVVWVEGYDGDAELPYAILARALRVRLGQLGPAWKQAPPRLLAEAARLLPDLADEVDLPVPPPLDSPGAKARFFEAADLVLFGWDGDARTVVVIDGLHSADEASLEFVAYLARRLGSRPARVIATWRPEAIPAGHLLRRLPDRPDAITWVRPAALSLHDVTELMAPGEQEWAGELHELSGGNPFVFLEYLAARRRGSLDPVPPSVRALLASRIGGLAEPELEALSAASAVGRVFDAELVAGAAGLDEASAVAAIEALVGRGLLRELAAEDPLFDFAHPLLRDHTLGLLSTARRRLLHRRIADALGARSYLEWDPGAVAAEIASHLRAGGRPREAAAHLATAGEHARALAAFADAADHFRAAVELGHPEPARLHEEAGTALVLAGSYGEALACFEAALGAGGDPARLQRDIGDVYGRLGEWRKAQRRYAAATRALGSGAPASERALLASERARAAHHLGDRTAAASHAAASLALAEQAGDPAVAVLSLNVAALLAAGAGDDERAEELLREGLELLHGAADPAAEAALLNNLAAVLGRTGRAAEGAELLRQALDRNAEVGDRHREAALRSNLADLMRASGDEPGALDQVKRSAALFAEVGRAPGSLEPEIWKLREW